jgi:hypothetical protein
MQDQVMRIAENTKKHLRKNAFYWSSSVQKVFAGWSFSSSSTVSDVDDGDIFEWRNYQDKIKPPTVGGTITLFATWIDYSDSDGYTEILLEFDDSQDEGADGAEEE